MAERRTSKGRCELCRSSFGKAAMTRHLRACRKRDPTLPLSRDKRSERRTMLLHITVEGSYLPQYWMHLEAPSRATLRDLDGFLRDTWVECCGHMSAFTIQERRYIAGAGIDAMWIGVGLVPGGRNMDVALNKVLSPGLKFDYEYDFGTTTELRLKVVGERQGKASGRAIQLLARNDPPLIICNACGKIATRVCSQCIWDDGGWLCNKCGRKHPCGEDMLLPVVNSPRVGMCGYTG